MLQASWFELVVPGRGAFGDNDEQRRLGGQGVSPLLVSIPSYR